MADLHHTTESGKGFLIDFLASEQLRVIEEIAEEPPQLPQGLGGAVHPEITLPASSRGSTMDRRKNFNGTSLLNFDGFAPASQWVELSSPSSIKNIGSEVA
jgi:hypothetical protein